MGTSKAAECHRIEPLARETGISNAIQMPHTGSVERHRQKTGELHRRNRAIAALKTSKEAAVTARRSDLLMGDRSLGPQIRSNR